MVDGDTHDDGSLATREVSMLHPRRAVLKATFGDVHPNQSLEPTPKSVMHPAAQAARQSWAWLSIKR